MFINIGKIHTIIAAPSTGLNKKLNWNTFTCGAVLEITPKIISCANVASKIGDAICKPIYSVFEDIFISKSIVLSCGHGTCDAYIGKISKLLTSALKSQ